MAARRAETHLQHECEIRIRRFWLTIDLSRRMAPIAKRVVWQSIWYLHFLILGEKSAIEEPIAWRASTSLLRTFFSNIQFSNFNFHNELPTIFSPSAQFSLSTYFYGIKLGFQKNKYWIIFPSTGVWVPSGKKNVCRGVYSVAVDKHKMYAAGPSFRPFSLLRCRLLQYDQPPKLRNDVSLVSCRRKKMEYSTPTIYCFSRWKIFSNLFCRSINGESVVCIYVRVRLCVRAGVCVSFVLLHTVHEAI